MKNNALKLIYVLTIYAICILSMTTSCNSYTEKDKDYEDVRSIYVVDIHGDTVKITGGATCHLDKKVK